MSLVWVTSISRWVLPLIAVAIVVICGSSLIRGNRKTGTIGYLVNTANSDRMPLRFAETSIGRSTTCDIVLNYNTVSRFHAVIAYRNGKWILFDTNSKTGTMVNKDRIIDKKYLENGDILVFGNAMFKFFDELPVNPEHTKSHPSSYAKPAPQADTFAKDSRLQNSDIVIAPMVKEIQSGCTLKNLITGEVMYLHGMKEVLIGRSHECHIRIDRPSVSRYHALITPSGHGKWMLEDMQSQAGTLLNGEEVVQPTPLFDGDIIEICGYTIKFNDPNA